MYKNQFFSYRLSIDKVMLHFQYQNYSPLDAIDRSIKRRDIFTEQIPEINFSSLQYGKFKNVAGWTRCNFFDRKKYIYCYYQPLIQLKNIVIFWILLDLKSGCAKSYFNCNYLYMLDHHITPISGNHDDNYIPIAYDFTWEDIILILHKACKTAQKEIIACFNRFNYPLLEFDFSLASIEVDVEVFNMQVCSLDLSKLRQKIMVRYMNTTHTIYMNPIREAVNTQLKIYDKTYNLLRFEFTFFSFPYVEEDIDEALLTAVKAAVNSYGIFETYNGFSKSKELALADLAALIKLTPSEILFLAENRDMKFNRMQQALKRRLINRHLISKANKRGWYELSPQCQNLILQLPLEQMDLIHDLPAELFDPLFHARASIMGVRNLLDHE